MAVRVAICCWVGRFRVGRRCDERRSGWKEGFDALEEVVARRRKQLREEPYEALLKLPVSPCAAAEQQPPEATSDQATSESSDPKPPSSPVLRFLAGVLVLCYGLSIWGLFAGVQQDTGPVVFVLLIIAWALGGLVGVPILLLYALFGNRPFGWLAEPALPPVRQPTESPSDDPDLPLILGRQACIMVVTDPQSDGLLRVLVCGIVHMRWWPLGTWMVVDGFSATKDGAREVLPFEATIARVNKLTHATRLG